MRIEKVVKKEASDLKLPRKSNEKYSRVKLDDLIIRLAEAHGLI